MLIFDIETGPLPREELDRLMPEFEADKRLKDPAKIDADIAVKREEWLDRAALSAVTGQVLAIGFNDPDTNDPEHLMHDILGVGTTNENEEALLKQFWGILSQEQTTIEYITNDIKLIVGFNIKSFDLPFLVRRSWKYGIRPPTLLKGRYWNDKILDLAEIWQLGNHQQYTSLDTICKHLNLGEKNGSGKDFARLWANDRPKAIEYLTNDIKLTVALYNRLCG